MENVTQHNPVTHPLFLKGCGCDDVTEGMFGLSFSDDGQCKWQFIVDAVSARSVRVTTFSWVDGSDFSTETVARKFLRESCLLFREHRAFLNAADYWGGGRRNPLFVKGAAE